MHVGARTSVWGDDRVDLVDVGLATLDEETHLTPVSGGHR